MCGILHVILRLEVPYESYGTDKFWFVKYSLLNVKDKSYNTWRLTTAHPWCGGHSIRISACGLWGVGGKGRSSSLQERVSHTYTCT